MQATPNVVSWVEREDDQGGDLRRKLSRQADGTRSSKASCKLGFSPSEFTKAASCRAETLA